MGTNKCASQSGMTAYGTRRHLYDPKNHILPPMDHSTISLQMGTNKCASQVGPPQTSTRFPAMSPPRAKGSSLGARPCRSSPTENPTLGFPPTPLALPALSLLQLTVCSRGSYYPALCLSFPQRFAQRLSISDILSLAGLMHQCDGLGAFGSLGGPEPQPGELPGQQGELAPNTPALRESHW